MNFDTVGSLCARDCKGVGNMSTKENVSSILVQKVYDSYRRHNYEEMGDICQTVSAFYGTGGGNVPIVLRYERNEELLRDELR